MYHYTDIAGLQGILESRTLWATDIRYLNDETEAKYSRDLLGSVAERLRPEFGGDWAASVVCNAVAAMATSGTFPDTFVASLCDDGDNLSQWRGYGAQGRGYAIGLDREQLWAIANASGHSLIRLLYEVNAQETELERALREAIPILAGWLLTRRIRHPRSNNSSFSAWASPSQPCPSRTPISETKGNGAWHAW